MQVTLAHDDHGRTELMLYVASQERAIENIQKEIELLWDTCYEEIEYSSGCGIFKETKTVTIKKTSCTNKDLQALLDRENYLIQYISDIITHIQYLVLNGADVTAKDFDGQTVLNYCQSQEIYEALRSLGAPFQYKVFIWIYSGEIIFYTVATGMAITVGYALVNKMLTSK